jgi:CRISPR-associated protein Cmr6
MKGFEIGMHLNRADLSGLHVGLVMGALAPIDPRQGKVPDDVRGPWLADLANVTVSPDYKTWYDGRWKDVLGRALAAPVEAETRLLVGAGDASAVDVGLRVHHTWGVPCIPGSALKGLLSHWLDVVYGPSPEHDGRHPWDPGHPEADRAKFRRASPFGRPPHGAGEVQRILFGSPDVDADREPLHERGALAPGSRTTACRGRIVIHDAMFVPGSAGDKPFLADVLTVHHAGYYQGKGPANDHESPNPVGFLSVRPGVQMLLAVDLAPGEDPAYGPWVDFAFGLLVNALADWGIGSKTAAGYGRFAAKVKPRRAGKAADDTRDQLAAWLTATIDDLRTILDGPDGPAAFVAEIVKHHGDSIRAVSGETRKQRLQAVYSFLNKELKASDSKRKAIRQKLDAAFGD